MLVAIVDERGELRIRLEHNRTAIAAVAAVRPSLWHKRLTPERHAASAAVAAANIDSA
jgi:hypothetical protein